MLKRLFFTQIYFQISTSYVYNSKQMNKTLGFLYKYSYLLNKNVRQNVHTTISIKYVLEIMILLS